jgi:2-C-methyl-D-erythritol 4-phosphate cytidylyltransferase
MSEQFPLPSQTSSSNYAIIVAGGSGTRMNAALPKQFLLLSGRPVLMYTLEVFSRSDAKPELILVLPQSYHIYWKDLCRAHNFNLPHHLVNGGDTRFQSVKNGLELLPDEALVAVHDAVRPTIDAATIDMSYQVAADKGSAVVAVMSRDSIRRVTENGSEALIRDEIYLVQTPQTFQATLLKDAYNVPYRNNFTDDASVVEQAGHSINVIPGNYQNIKITYPEDIAIAELLLKQKATL